MLGVDRWSLVGVLFTQSGKGSEENLKRGMILYQIVHHWELEYVLNRFYFYLI